MVVARLCLPLHLHPNARRHPRVVERPVSLNILSDFSEEVAIDRAESVVGKARVESSAHFEGADGSVFQWQ